MPLSCHAVLSAQGVDQACLQWPSQHDQPPLCPARIPVCCRPAVPKVCSGAWRPAPPGHRGQPTLRLPQRGVATFLSHTGRAQLQELSMPLSEVIVCGDPGDQHPPPAEPHASHHPRQTALEQALLQADQQPLAASVAASQPRADALFPGTFDQQLAPLLPQTRASAAGSGSARRWPLAAGGRGSWRRSTPAAAASVAHRGRAGSLFAGAGMNRASRWWNCW